jgi:N-acetylated-alpha-linked acidic dipeptidase
MSLSRAAGILLAVLLVAPRGAAAAALLGFGPASSEAERRSEQAFDQAIDPAQMKAWLEQMASAPNQVGSPHDKANAEFILSKFREWGWDARIETFTVEDPMPRSVSLEMVSPTPFKARLMEDSLAPDSGALPAYNAFGADGDVTADLVYVNFGMPEDYAELARLGIDVRGRVVIARYGKGWRGLKPKLAQEHGAVGCVIYSDPHEDGYWAGDALPKGPYRPADGIQRGSVADETLSGGDPSRRPEEEARGRLSIPVLPIGYGDATPLLGALGGPVAPASWRGALALTYHVGPGPARVRLAVASDWGRREIYDVVAFMRGASEPDQWVIRGNHHDAWVFGAWDPLSGTVSLMAEARAIGTLAGSGWHPRRTLVYASWDAEEPGLMGSTAWAEAHAAELARSAVLYVNSDTNARGTLSAGGSHSFQRLVNEVASGVADPETGASVLDRLRANVRVRGMWPGGTGEDQALELAADSGGELPLFALGSGSDYTPFLHHLGIAAVDLEFRGEAPNGGIYHSAYDTADHFEKYGDPGFGYSVALAETAGRAVLRTADADILPLRFSGLAESVSRYAREVGRLLEHEREEARRVSRLVDDGSFRIAADPQAPAAAPPRPSDVPSLDFVPLATAATRFASSAAACDAALDAAARSGFAGIAPSRLRELNVLLQGFEQTLLSRDGLPGRPWYRHTLYAPGAMTGYGAKTLPAIREAIELGNWEDARSAIPQTAADLGVAARRLDAVVGRLQAGLGTGPAGTGALPPPPPDS